MTEPEADSTKLSIPNPSRATDPDAMAAAIATTPSTMFQPTVRYSRRSARASRRGRSIGASVIGGV